MAPLIEVRSVVKRFPGIVALDRVSLTVGAGEVVAVVGENGAGKSTLMKILAGVQCPDSGEIFVSGEPATIHSVREAQRLGIALIHQELNLADNLSVAENIFLGREPRHGVFVDRRRTGQGAVAVLRQVGLNVAPETCVRNLPIGHQQMVEIAKALSADARLLIMDEPTSSLSHHETEALFRVVEDLRGRGVSIIYISHRLGEVRRIADRVVVLRDGRNAGELQRNEISHDNLVRLMVGRDFKITHEAPKTRGHVESSPVLLEVRKLRTYAHPLHELTFSLRAGEIVGIAGLVGAGRTEMLETLFGVHKRRAGAVLVDGMEIPSFSPIDAIRAGLALVPEDRKLQGVFLEMAVGDNLALAALRSSAHAGFRDRAAERAIAAEMIPKLNVRTAGARQIVQTLSGGNQQKVVLGKWLALRPKVLLLDEPTRGIDVGAKQEIYHLMEELADAGLAVLFASSEMEEILRVSQRVLVMHQGRFSGELLRKDLTENAVMQLATGAPVLVA